VEEEVDDIGVWTAAGIVTGVTAGVGVIGVLVGVLCVFVVQYRTQKDCAKTPLKGVAIGPIDTNRMNGFLKFNSTQLDRQGCYDKVETRPNCP
jgi:hypothetical protein